MQLDTGAGRSMIGANSAVDLGVTMLPAEEASVNLKGVIGSEKARVGILKSLNIGGWRLDGYPCIVRVHQNILRGGFVRRKLPSDLLGFDLALRHASFLTIDYPAGVAVYGFGSAYTPPRGNKVRRTPLKIRQGVPFVTLTSGGYSWDALVDSGSFNGIEISQEVAKRLGLEGKGVVAENLYLMAVGGTSSATDLGMEMVRLGKMAGFGATFSDVHATISPGLPRVGTAFLRYYRVTFDFRRKVVWLEG